MPCTENSNIKLTQVTNMTQEIFEVYSLINYIPHEKLKNKL